MAYRNNSTVSYFNDTSINILVRQSEYPNSSGDGPGITFRKSKLQNNPEDH
jgi:hypothetical protein